MRGRLLIAGLALGAMACLAGRASALAQSACACAARLPSAQLPHPRRPRGGEYKIKRPVDQLLGSRVQFLVAPGRRFGA